MNETKKTNAVNLQRSLDLMKECKTAREGLALIAGSQYQLPPGESYALADEIITRLTAYKVPEKKPQPAICNALNDFYMQEIMPREAEVRIGILRRMNFAMDIFFDEGMLIGLEECSDFSVLYGSIFDEDHEESISEEILQRDRLLRGITQLNLSAPSVKYLAKQLAEGEFYISNILAMAMDTFFLRAATALHLCLSEKALSPAEAVPLAINKTCLDIYPLRPIEQGVSAAILILAGLITIFFTEYFMGYYDLPLFLSETFGIVAGLILFQELDQRRDRLHKGILTLFIRKRTVSSPKKI